MIGIMPLIMCSCNPPTVKGTVYSCVTSQKLQVARCGKRIIDYKQDRVVVGEWQNKDQLTTMPLSEMPDQLTYDLEDWLLRIKPTIKSGHDFWADYQGVK
jgi:hypothetical protein